MTVGAGLPRTGVSAVRGLPIRFFMYEGRQLDHGYLRHCPGFEHMQHSAYNERLGEVYLRDSLAVHPWRTRSPSEATLFFVPIWEIVSFNVDECNGTSHKQRMAMAAAALLSAPSYRKPRLAKRPPGFDHLIASTGCIENGRRMAERLTSPLFRLLTSSIVGRDRACAIDRWRTLLPCLLCVRMLTRASARASRSALLRSLMRTDSAFYAANAVGRCTIELPYVSNPHGRQARRLLARTSAAGNAGTGGKRKRAFGNNVTFATSIVTAGLEGSSRSGGGGTSNGEGVGVGSVHGGRRPWLLVFTGSLDVCCEPGKSIRHVDCP
jgi:hypothetical protein